MRSDRQSARRFTIYKIKYNLQGLINTDYIYENQGMTRYPSLNGICNAVKAVVASKVRPQANSVCSWICD